GDRDWQGDWGAVGGGCVAGDGARIPNGYFGSGGRSCAWDGAGAVSGIIVNRREGNRLEYARRSGGYHCGRGSGSRHACRRSGTAYRSGEDAAIGVGKAEPRESALLIGQSG